MVVFDTFKDADENPIFKVASPRPPELEADEPSDLEDTSREECDHFYHRQWISSSLACLAWAARCAKTLPATSLRRWKLRHEF